MNITTTFPAPNAMNKNLVLLTLITNSTKYAIYDYITNTHIYNLSKFTDLWQSFAVYSLQFTDIDNGVDFTMEYCSATSDLTDIITTKIQSDSLTEIDHHIQSLLRDNIPNAAVSISVQDSESTTDSKINQGSSSSDNEFGILLAFFIVLIVIFIVVIIIFIIWYKKNQKKLQEAADLDLSVNVSKKPLESKVNEPGVGNKNDKDGVIEMSEAVKNVHIPANNNMVHVEANNKSVVINEGQETKKDALSKQSENESSSSSLYNGNTNDAKNEIDFIFDNPFAVNDNDVLSEINQTPKQAFAI